MIMKMRWLRDRRERRYWADLLTRSGMSPGRIRVRYIAHTAGECQVHCLDKTGGLDYQCLARWVAVHKRLPADSVRAGEADGGFVMYSPGG